MFKIILLIIILFVFVTIYSFKKKIDNILDGIFPSRSSNKNKEGPEELVKCQNCGVYVPKSSAVKKIRLRGDDLYFCSQKCKEEYKKRKK